MADKEQVKDIDTLCIEENLSYTTDLYTNYSFPMGEDKKTRVDIRRYNFPLSDEAAASIAQRNHISTGDVAKASLDIAAGIVRDYKISNFLKSKEIRSTLRYHSYKKESGNVTSVYEMTDGLIPLSEIWNHKDLTVGFVIDIARRLYAICADLDKIGVTHRNITPYNVFFTADTNRLVLGGFNCAMLPGETKPVVNPFVYTCHMAPAIKAGERGDLTTDVYSISSMIGCMLEGDEITEEFRDALPMAIPANICEAITLGRSLNRDNLPQFRKYLNQLYKEAHGLYWEIPVSMLYQKRIETDSNIASIIEKATPDVEEPNNKEARGKAKTQKKEQKAAKKAAKKNARADAKAAKSRRSRNKKDSPAETVPDDETSVDTVVAAQETQEDHEEPKKQKKKKQKKAGNVFGTICSLLLGALVMCLILLVVGYVTGYVAFE